MTDVVDAATRSRMMAGIRGTHTKPERQIRSLLHKRGFRFRLHVKELPGRPDIALPRHGAVILVHGCFWHGHSCPLFRLPATRPEFWIAKIKRNRENDCRATAALAAAGWRVATVWECALRGRTAMDEDVLTDQLVDWIKKEERTLELPEPGDAP